MVLPGFTLSFSMLKNLIPTRNPDTTWHSLSSKHLVFCVFFSLIFTPDSIKHQSFRCFGWFESTTEIQAEAPCLMVYTTHKNGDDWGTVYDCFNHIIALTMIVHILSTYCPYILADLVEVGQLFWPEIIIKHGG